ncbi:ent-kaurenoic acid oxidase 2 [Cryptomeria japonica]|uniref:ent-kaurenoic acid oxidase 2 n=1 Tax=Cryptomeria japonica TaxID=3369 RepID=UPI0027DAB4E3|nr:ent-kaurenoic acid oxidase 2 [Cryptomeria japonica]
MDAMWAVGLGLGLLPLVIWVLRSFNEWRYCYPHLTFKNGRKLPPGHLGWPIIGELVDFLWCFKFAKRPDDFIWNRIARYGDTGVYRSHLFGSPAIITCSPEANKFMTGGTESGSLIAGWPSPQVIGTSSIAMVEGAQHKRIRRYLMEAINSPESLKRMFITLQPSLREALKNWALKGTIAAFHEVNEVQFSNICRLLFSFQSAPMLKEMRRIYTGLVAGLRAQPINLPGTAFHSAVKCRKKLSAMILSEMHDRRANKSNIKEDFLQNLMDSVDSNGEKLNDEEILDNMVSLILAGYASTSLSMTWALYYLAKYPSVLHKLREENRLIREKKGKDEHLIYEDIKDMTYTSKVIDEVVRVSHVSSFVFRTVAKDIEFNGYIFPKGWKVIIWLRSNHVDPRYFENPLEFKPERWDGPKPKAGAYYAFGSGPRLCPGSNLAKMQLFMFLHLVSNDYKWELENPNSKIKHLPHSMVVDGAKMKFSHI